MTNPTNGADATVASPVTVIEFCLDETGSMSRHKQAVLKGFNTFLAEQKAAEGDCRFSLTKFDTSGIKTPYVDLDIAEVPNLNDNTFTPREYTNLYDVIGYRIQAVEARLELWTNKPNVLIIVMTDGSDNASKAFTPSTIAAMLSSKMEQGWTFVFLGADQNAALVAGKLGFLPDNIKSFASSEFEATMVSMSGATTAYRATRSAGQTGTYASYFAGE